MQDCLAVNLVCGQHGQEYQPVLEPLMRSQRLEVVRVRLGGGHKVFCGLTGLFGVVTQGGRCIDCDCFGGALPYGSIGTGIAI